MVLATLTVLCLIGWGILAVALVAGAVLPEVPPEEEANDA